ncbi:MULTISPECIES: hypothetical protein [Paenibacillus]|uniref:hypothetical protein n=1 Tax=Paenibacillus TaxID=44249 RepID=UPI0015B7A3A8|nr:hypothetical protein [Paenibacillus odorifer]
MSKHEQAMSKLRASHEQTRASHQQAMSLARGLLFLLAMTNLNQLKLRMARQP